VIASCFVFSSDRISKCDGEPPLTAHLTAEPTEDNVFPWTSVDAPYAIGARNARWWTAMDELDRAVGSNPTSSANPTNRLHTLIRRLFADEFGSTHDSRTWKVLCFLLFLSFVFHQFSPSPQESDAVHPTFLPAICYLLEGSQERYSGGLDSFLPSLQICYSLYEALLTFWKMVGFPIREGIPLLLPSLTCKA
jgi:hypothetical protein